MIHLGKFAVRPILFLSLTACSEVTGTGGGGIDEVHEEVRSIAVLNIDILNIGKNIRQSHREWQGTTQCTRFDVSRKDGLQIMARINEMEYGDDVRIESFVDRCERHEWWAFDTEVDHVMRRTNTFSQSIEYLIIDNGEFETFFIASHSID